jgi:XTP/dITP diphosphohydrolase/ATP diphosphatase
MPAMLEAAKLGSKAAKVGFDWPNSDGSATELFEKLEEEIAELKAELRPNETTPAAVSELGDLLFTVVNLSRHLRIDPEAALRETNAKFRRRFGAMESAAGGTEALERKSAAQLEALWSQAKIAEVDTAHSPDGGEAE